MAVQRRGAASRKEGSGTPSSNSLASKGKRSAGASVAIGAAVVAALFFGLHSYQSSPPPSSSDGGSPEQSEDSLGPMTMASQAALLNRLTQLLQEVDVLRGGANKSARDLQTTRVMFELDQIEKQIQPSTPTGKQHAALVSFVRSALKSDRDGKDFTEDMSDEKLLETHGLVTYATQSYWDEAYAGKKYGESFDWYASWTGPSAEGMSLADVVRPLVSTSGRILIVGCGNSNMSSLMYKEGYEQITNIDFAAPVIDEMKIRYADLTKMSWQAMDASRMDFENDTFDTVLEKGFFDAMLAGTGERVQAVLQEAARVLRPGGRLVSMTLSGDRLQRFLMPKATQAAIDRSPLDCGLERQLKYVKADNSSNHASFYVYKCERP